MSDCTCTYGLPPIKRDCPRHGHLIRNTEERESVASPLEEEVSRLRKRNSELQRRCQLAESAVVKFKRDWDKHGGPRGGSFGRALLASYADMLERKLEERAAC